MHCVDVWHRAYSGDDSIPPDAVSHQTLAIMKGKWLLGVALIGSSCAPFPAYQELNASPNSKPASPSPTAETVSNTAPVASDESESKTVPSKFMGVDFKNFSFPTNWRNRRVRLKNGEFVHPEGAGGNTYKFVSVDFAELEDSRHPIAVVRLLLVSCGISCDGGSHLFYFYTIRNRRPSLFWRIETSSLGYECGLRSFVLNKKNLTLEVFRTCQTKGSSIQESDDWEQGEDGSSGEKFRAKSFTRFVFEFNNGRFIRRRRQVLPNPNPDIINYEPQISIGV